MFQPLQVKPDFGTQQKKPWFCLFQYDDNQFRIAKLLLHTGSILLNAEEGAKNRPK